MPKNLVRLHRIDKLIKHKLPTYVNIMTLQWISVFKVKLTHNLNVIVPEQIIDLQRVTSQMYIVPDIILTTQGCKPSNKKVSTFKTMLGHQGNKIK